MHLALPLALTSLTAVAVIAAVAGAVFGLGALVAWQVGMAIYLQDRMVSYLTAATLSCAITTLALSILFPPSMLVAIPVTSFMGAFSCAYTLVQILRRQFQ